MTKDENSFDIMENFFLRYYGFITNQNLTADAE
jgi:hypothetical protein